MKVCESWHWFPNFLADMGTPPPGCSLERLDGDGSYSPENCEWATRSKQMRNTRNTRRIEFRGLTKCLTEWARVVGVSERTLSKRLELWPLERAMTEPKHRKGVNQ